MSDFEIVIINFLNSVVKALSDYVHTDMAFVINTEITDLVKYCADEFVIVLREILDIFGR